MEERIECLDNSQKVVVQMVDVKPALDMVRDKVVDLSIRLNLVTRAVGNQISTRGCSLV